MFPPGGGALCSAFRSALGRGICEALNSTNPAASVDCNDMNVTQVEVQTRRRLDNQVSMDESGTERFDEIMSSGQSPVAAKRRQLSAVVASLSVEYQLKLISEAAAATLASAVNNDPAAFALALKDEITATIAADTTIQTLAPTAFAIASITPAIISVKVVENGVLLTIASPNATNGTNFTTMSFALPTTTTTTTVGPVFVVAPPPPEPYSGWENPCDCEKCVPERSCE